MPAKNRFTKEQIIDAALSLVREKGSSALSARTLAKRLGASPQPIFSYFDSMESLREAVVDAAKEIYAERVKVGLSQTPAFKGAGEQYILFAKEEPELFQLLFMSENDPRCIPGFMPAMDDNSPDILSSLKMGYALEDGEAKKIYNHLAIYSHGIATLSLRNTCSFTREEISEMLSEVFIGVLNRVKEERSK